MAHRLFYCAGSTVAAIAASRLLEGKGIPLAYSPDRDVTDLLLDIPSFDSRGDLRDGEDPEALFGRLAPGTRVWGGKLAERLPEPLIGMDLLQDPVYLSENAAITADCALRIAGSLLKTTWVRSRVLVIGWGRIGKALSKTLKLLGADVTVSARKASDRALMLALGYSTTPDPTPWAKNYDLIFNTVPAPVVSSGELAKQPKAIAVDLASLTGLAGERVIRARGLPGIYAPEASGALICDTILRLGRGV